MADKDYVTLRGSRRAKDPLSSRVGGVDPNEEITVTIDLVGPKLPSADEHIGETLTPEEVAARFAAKQEDADRVASSLARFGLEVEGVSLSTRSLRVHGTAAAIEAAFRPKMEVVRSASLGEYRGRQGAIAIPADLKGIVKGVFGLDQRQMARRKTSLPGPVPAPALAALTPADLEQRYNFPPGTATGQKIAIAAFGGGYFADDTIDYCAKFNRALPNIRPIPVGAPAYTLLQIVAHPEQQRGEELRNSQEIMMDVQIIAALCPGADIDVYFSTSDQRGWVDLLDRVIAARPVALSISWGLAEDDPSWSRNAIDAINDRLNLCRLLGITTCVASGDDGSGDQIDDGKAHVDFPSCSPHTLSVGGTMLEVSGAGIDEVTWFEAPGRRTSHGGGATGGGVSTVFPRPAFQTVIVPSLNLGSIDGRVTPDVAALAGEPAYDLIFVGHSFKNGGTSASAPLWAALVARINANLPVAKQQRFLTPLLYGLGANGQPIGGATSRDITSGHNASSPNPGQGYRAGNGFDAVTGWGAPDGVKLLDAL